MFYAKVINIIAKLCLPVFLNEFSYAVKYCLYMYCILRMHCVKIYVK